MFNPFFHFFLFEGIEHWTLSANDCWGFAFRHRALIRCIWGLQRNLTNSSNWIIEVFHFTHIRPVIIRPTHLEWAPPSSCVSWDCETKPMLKSSIAMNKSVLSNTLTNSSVYSVRT